MSRSTLLETAGSALARKLAGRLDVHHGLFWLTMERSKRQWRVWTEGGGLDMEEKVEQRPE